MYYETRLALIKTLKISKILFFMGKYKFNKLSRILSNVKPPNKEVLSEYMKQGMSTKEAIQYALKEKYVNIATNNGFTEEQGVAMLEYAILLKEINS